ncbi:MAG: TonB-dependent receptor plug domain-containing protein [Balneolaceae bacterium]|jgi:TonB-dependent SusC/RagA subfamily outer membrane receptor
MRSYLFSFLILLLIVGCASSGQVSGTKSGNKTKSSDISVRNPSISLADYLRRVPGVQVFGDGSSAQVMVRGAMSVHGNTSPLFVVDGTRIGRDFSRVQSMIPVNTIDRIRVLKGVDASSAYGMEGSAGVIVIKTKS